MTLRDTFLPFSPPFIGEEEVNEVIDTLRSDWLTTGPKVKRFEQEFSAFLGAPAALALNSCTAALHTALVTLGIGPGDAVVTTPMTFCASVNVIEHVGATPILVDVEPDTLNIDPHQVEAAVANHRRKRSLTGRPSAVGGRILAVIPVHLYGHPCEMDAILDIARRYGLAVIEDAAHALPAWYKGKLVGSFSTFSSIPILTCFSFYATKNLTTAEGGMLTGAPELLDRARVWSLHGMSRDAWKRYTAKGSWYYEVVYPGFKYNMTDIQAAIGLHQLRKLPWFHARRREIVSRYNEAFSQVEELRIPIERPEVEHAWHLYVLRLNLDMLTVDRAQFVEELRARNIGTSVHFIPVHLHPYYRDNYDFKKGDFPTAEAIFESIISLPLYPKMTERDVEDVIQAVKRVVARNRA